MLALGLLRIYKRNNWNTVTHLHTVTKSHNKYPIQQNHIIKISADLYDYLLISAKNVNILYFLIF